MGNSTQSGGRGVCATVGERWGQAPVRERSARRRGGLGEGLRTSAPPSSPPRRDPAPAGGAGSPAAAPAGSRFIEGSALEPADADDAAGAIHAGVLHMLRPAPVGAPPRSWWRAGAGADAPCGGRPRASSMGLPLKERGCECELFGGSSRPRLEDPPGRGPCEFDPPGRGPCEFICAGGGRSLWYGWGAICCGCGGPGAIICCCGAMGRCPPGGAMKCCCGGWRCIICGGGICGGIRCIICGGGCCGPGARCGGGPMCCGMWGGICCGGAGRWGHMARGCCVG